MIGPSLHHELFRDVEISHPPDLACASTRIARAVVLAVASEALRLRQGPSFVLLWSDMFQPVHRLTIALVRASASRFSKTDSVECR